MSMRATEGPERMNIVGFPRDLHTALKVEAARREITLRELVIAILRKAVSKSEINDILGANQPATTSGSPPAAPASSGPRVERRQY